MFWASKRESNQPGASDKLIANLLAHSVPWVVIKNTMLVSLRCTYGLVVWYVPKSSSSGSREGGNRRYRHFVNLRKVEETESLEKRLTKQRQHRTRYTF